MNWEDQLLQLQDLQSEANLKARNAQKVMDLQGYKDYQDWVVRYTTVNKPEVRDLNGLISYIANCLIFSGVRFGASYFDAIQHDALEIENQIQELSNFSDNNNEEDV